MEAPSGTLPVRLKARWLGGRSGSVALTRTVRVESSSASWTGISCRTGGSLTSLTVTLKAREWAAPAPSRTVTLRAWIAGPWSSAGVQVKVPLAGSMAAPSGAPSSEKARPVAGGSRLETFAVKVRRVSSSTARSGIPSRTGGGARPRSMPSRTTWTPFSVWDAAAAYMTGPILKTATSVSSERAVRLVSRMAPAGTGLSGSVRSISCRALSVREVTTA